MLATEFKQRLEELTRGQVEVSICDNKDVLMRPAINWNAAPDFAKQLLRDFLDTPREELRARWWPNYKPRDHNNG